MNIQLWPLLETKTIKLDFLEDSEPFLKHDWKPITYSNYTHSCIKCDCLKVVKRDLEDKKYLTWYCKRNSQATTVRPNCIS